MTFQGSFLSNCQRKITELQKRVATVGSGVLSRTQKWRRMSMVSLTECDVVVTFGRGTNEANVQWFVQLLQDRVPELAFQLHNHRISNQMALYLTACYGDLLMGAEELGLKKPLATAHGGGLREFSMEQLELFEDAKDENVFLSSSERSVIVHHYLMGLRAREGDTWNDAVKFNDGQPLIRPLQSIGLIDQIFPVHCTEELNKLKHEWIRLRTVKQPLDGIRRYFGAQIALYFAWLGHYTCALLFPAIIGLLVWLFVDSKRYKFYHLFMAVLSLMWSTVYLEHWKRTSAVLTYQWGVWDAPPALLEESRPQFMGKLSPCPITGRLVRVYPTWRRQLIMCCFTGPVIIVSLTAVICVTLGFVQLQGHVDVFAADMEMGGMAVVLSLLPKVLLAVTIILMDYGYRSLATWLTDLENHRLDSEYHSHLLGKLLLLQFMNSFYSLFYTAFYLQDMDLLQQQLTTILITRQILGNLREVFLPYGQSRLRQFILSFRFERQKRDTCEISLPKSQLTTEKPSIVTQSSSEPETDSSVRHRRPEAPTPPPIVAEDVVTVSPQEREATLLSYDGPDEDFLEMFLQFGHVSMFSCVFPVAGFLALINNLIEIRGDAFKLVASHQRPFAQSAVNIGIWELAMSTMGYVAVVVNIGLLSVSDTMHELAPKATPVQSVLALVAIEHLIFIFHYVLVSVIPTIPTSLVEQIAKLEHRRREALRTLERESMREYQRHRSTSRSRDASHVPLQQSTTDSQHS